MKPDATNNGRLMLEEDDRLFEEGLFILADESDGKPRLNAQKCLNCGALLYPPKKLCPKCRSDRHLQEKPVGPYGTLFTYSVVRIGPPPYTGMTPYAIGYVDLDDGIRVFAQIAADDLETLKIGMRVELIIDRLYTDEDGINIIGYKFRPLGSGQE